MHKKSNKNQIMGVLGDKVTKTTMKRTRSQSLINKSFDNATEAKPREGEGKETLSQYLTF